MATVHDENSAAPGQPRRSDVNCFAGADHRQWGRHHSIDPSIEGVGSANKTGKQVVLGHRAHHLSQGERWFSLDDRHLRDAVLAQDRYGFADGLVRVNVD
jgi:hypothetical protein